MLFPSLGLQEEVPYSVAIATPLPKEQEELLKTADQKKMHNKK